MKNSILIASCLISYSISITHASESAYPSIISEEHAPVSDALVRNYVLAWINCFECTAGELQRVVENGVQATPILTEIIAGDPTYFPNRETEFSGQWARLMNYIVTSGFEGTIPEETFIGLQETAIRNIYVARAQKALDLIAHP